MLYHHRPLGKWRSMDSSSPVVVGYDIGIAVWQRYMNESFTTKTQTHIRKRQNGDQQKVADEKMLLAEDEKTGTKTERTRRCCC